MSEPATGKAAKMRPATRFKSRDSSSPMSSLKTSSAGRPSIAMTMLSRAALMRRTGPIGEQPWVKPVMTGISGDSSTPETPPSTTRPAIWAGVPDAAARPPTRNSERFMRQGLDGAGRIRIARIAVNDAEHRLHAPRATRSAARRDGERRTIAVRTTRSRPAAAPRPARRAPARRNIPARWRRRRGRRCRPSRRYAYADAGTRGCWARSPASASLA